MTKAELNVAEDLIYEAIRKAYGYDTQADALVDLVMDLVEQAKDDVKE